MKLRNWWLIGIIVLGAFLRLSAFIFAQPWTEVGEERILSGSGDIISYHYLAHDLVLYGRYGGHPQADPYNLDPVIRPLGYALFIAFWYWLFTPKLWIPLLVQVLLSVASIALLYTLCREEFSEIAARVASLMFTIYANSILFASTLMTETLYIFVMLLFLYGWVRLKKQFTLNSKLVSYSILSVVLLGTILGLGVYVRVSTVYFAILFPLVFWFMLNNLSLAQRLATISAFLVAVGITIAPYSLYMYNRYGTVRLTMVDDYNMLLNTIAHALHGRASRKDERVQEQKNQLRQELHQLLEQNGIDIYHSNPFERAPYFRQLAWKYFTNYTREITIGMLNGMLRFWWLPDRLWEIADEVLPSRFPARTLLISSALVYASLYHLIWIVLLAVGVHAAWVRHKDWFWIFVVAALYFTIVTNSASNDRYRMQAAAFAFPLVGLGALHVVRAFSRAKQSSEVQSS